MGVPPDPIDGQYKIDEIPPLPFMGRSSSYKMQTLLGAQTGPITVTQAQWFKNVNKIRPNSSKIENIEVCRFDGLMI